MCVLNFVGKASGHADSERGVTCITSLFFLAWHINEHHRYNLGVTVPFTLSSSRTLLEKVLILHGWHCGYRDEQRRPDDRHRLSRHYYDVGMMALTDIADRAVENQALLKHIRDHTLTFFRRACGVPPKLWTN